MSMMGNQNIVQADGGGGRNGWLGKVLGGIARNKNERSMAQLQLDLHGAKSAIDSHYNQKDTAHRIMTETGAKSYLNADEHRNNLKAIKNLDKHAVNFEIYKAKTINAANKEHGLKLSSEDVVGNQSYSAKGGVKRQIRSTVSYNRPSTVDPSTNKGTNPTTAETQAGKGGTPSTKGAKGGTNPAGKASGKGSGKGSSTGPTVTPAKVTKPTVKKTTSSGGGLTEINNSNVTTGKRGSK